MCAVGVSTLKESDLEKENPTLHYVRHSILIILVAWVATVFSGDEPPKRIDGGVAPPIEIRIGMDDPDQQDRGLPLALKETRALLPSMRRSETRRFVILSDLSDNEVAAHGQLLERAAHAVETFRKDLGLTAQVSTVERKMLAVAFSRRADFLWFARRHDKLEASWMAGYFAPNPGRLVYFHARDIPSARVAARQLDLLLEHDSKTSNARKSLEEFINQSTAAVVVHEAVHMILHARGIMRANSGVPLWLAEGVAASFEPVEPSRAFGPSSYMCGRTHAFREDLMNGKVPPLKVIVASTTLPAGDDDMVRSFYDASASLCGWLYREKPKSFSRMIKAVSSGEVGTSRESRIRLFEDHIGPIEVIEARWLAQERSRGGF